MLYWPFWKQDGMPNDRYGTVGTGLGAGTGAGTVQVRYGYDTWVRSVRYMGTVFVPMYRTDRTRTMYPNSGRNSGRSAAISAAIWVHGTDFCRCGYMVRVRSVRYMGTKTVPMYRTDRTHVSYPYRTRTVPVPYPHPYPQTNPYQPSRTHLNSSARTPPHHTSWTQ